jgi:hypothetical protein
VSRGIAGPVLVLTGAGIFLCLAGIAGIVAGLAFGRRIHALLPAEITSDPAAIGGAVVALGAALLLTGGLHLVAAAGLRADRGLVAGIVLCVGMAVLALGWAVTALVAAAAGSAPLAGMLPAGLGLSAGAAAYIWAAARLAGARRDDRGGA